MQKFSAERNNWIALVFLAPALLLLALFAFWPVLYGSYLSFTDYSLVKAPTWVGLQKFPRHF